MMMALGSMVGRRGSGEDVSDSLARNIVKVVAVLVFYRFVVLAVAALECHFVTVPLVQNLDASGVVIVGIWKDSHLQGGRAGIPRLHVPFGSASKVVV